MIDIWVYLSETPLLWLSATLVIYKCAYFLYQKSRFIPLLNPVLISIIFLVTLLLLTHTPYETYFDGAQFIHFLLGPTTVALAIPLYNQVNKLRQKLIPLLAGLFIGSSVGIGSAVLIGKLFGLNDLMLVSLSPKSITTPIAMGVAEKVGGIPSLTAVLVILTGIIGATFARELFALFRVKDESAKGFAIGLSSHGIGTARAFQLSEEAGAFSGLAMGLNGAMTALLVPFILRLLGL